ncbi:hypothetical protein [Kineococcus halophytocola]
MSAPADPLPAPADGASAAEPGSGEEWLSLDVRTGPDRAVIRVAGRLTASTGDLVVGVLDGTLPHAGGRGPSVLVLDLGGVVDCTPGGLRQVQRAVDHAGAAAVPLSVRDSPALAADLRPPRAPR